MPFSPRWPLPPPLLVLVHENARPVWIEPTVALEHCDHVEATLPRAREPRVVARGVNSVERPRGHSLQRRLQPRVNHGHEPLKLALVRFAQGALEWPAGDVPEQLPQVVLLSRNAKPAELALNDRCQTARDFIWRGFASVGRGPVEPSHREAFAVTSLGDAPVRVVDVVLADRLEVPLEQALSRRLRVRMPGQPRGGARLRVRLAVGQLVPLSAETRYVRPVLKG